MQKFTPDDPATKSADIVAGNVAHLATLFPEAFTEGKVDFEVLKQLLGGVVEERDEKYSINWYGKRRARQLALTPSSGTLRPRPEDSVAWDTTQNLLIEGDNLEVLKLLQKSFSGEVKLIYLDPPYNTGKDFVYPDDFQDNIKNYLKLTGQTDEEGKKLLSNSEGSGRFHTDWLDMIYPRLKLARNLLQKDGVIVVSIDDNEVNNLRRVLDEIFGEEQFLAQIVIQSNKRGQTYKQIAKTHEYLVVYSRNEDVELNELEKASDALPFNDSQGAFDLWELRNRNPKFGRFNRPNLFFPIYVLPNSVDECGYARVALSPDGRDSIKVLPLNSEDEEGCWRWGTDKIKNSDLVSSSPVLVARKRRDGEWNIYEKSRKSTTKAKSIWTETEFINEHGTIELGRIGMGDVFNHPKPVALLQRLIFMATGPDDIVMDIFAGSGTTGHAVMAQNSVDEGKRRWIIVQLPEPLDSDNKDQKLAAEFCDQIGKPRTIAELTKERLRRAGNKIKEEHPMFSGDLGFRVFKLDSSNIQTWDPDRTDLAASLDAHAQNLKVDRSEQDILFELLLKLGLDLTVPITDKKIAGHAVHSIGGGALIVCLSKVIKADAVEPLGQGILAWHKELKSAVETRVVFRDSAFADDVAKTNLSAILQQNGLEDVRSI